MTAAIVGFLGGFVILRLLDFMREWRGTADSIVTTRAAYYAKRSELERAEGNPATTPAIESDLDRLWGDLVRLLQRRDAAQFPRVVNRLTTGLLALMAVGIIWPLLALSGPSDWKSVGLPPAVGGYRSTLGTSHCEGSAEATPSTQERDPVARVGGGVPTFHSCARMNSRARQS